MFAQFSLLIQQLLAGAQQVPVLFLLQLGYRRISEQVIGVELRQLSGINAIRFNLSTSGAGDTGGRDDTAVIAFFSDIPLQGIADIRGLLTQPKGPARKAISESVELIQQALQRGSAFEAHHLAGVCVQGRTVVLSVIDIKADIDYILLHRHLRHYFLVVQGAT